MMKYLLLAVVLLVAISIWRHNHRKDRAASAPPRKPQLPEKENMLRCAHCGVHLPSSDALIDPQALPYCSAEHRRQGPHS